MIQQLESKKITDFERGPIRRSLFSNGAVSLFHHHKGMTSAVVGLYFVVGSIHEKPREEGLVHVIEHMLFKEGKDTNLVKELEFKGADINAYTYKEYVCFEMDCAADKLPEFLPMFLKLFFNPVFKEDDLELEKQVVIQELRDELDDHESMGHDYILERSFDRSLGHPIGGNVLTVSGFSCQDLRKFYNKYFSSSRMILAVTSGKPFAKLEKILIQEMSQNPRFDLMAKPIRYKTRDTFFHPNAFKKTVKRKIENAIYYFATGGPSLEGKYFYDLAVLDELFFEGLSSKFYMELREKHALLYGLGSAVNAFKDTGLYVMIFNAQKERIAQIKKQVKKIFSHYQQHGFDTSDVEAIKSRMIDGAYRSFDDIDERNEFIAMREIYGYKSFALALDLESIRKVNPKRLKYLLNKMIQGPTIELTIVPKQ